MPVSIDKTPRHDEATGWSGTAISYRRGEVDPAHYHLEGQLLFATRGVMLVEAADRQWVIPPQRALWIPPLMVHSYSVLSDTELRAVYVSSSLIAACTNFSRNSQVHTISATPLVKELINGLFMGEYNAPIKRKMALLLLDILSEAPSGGAELPMPRDERLFRAARELVFSHHWNASLIDLADIANMSERTFSRQFLRDTGFSFRTWKQRARIYASLDLLADNAPVKQIAYQLGFSCPAAFSAAFRSVMGTTPGEF
ncbi:AraC family transcriptional regulator [Kosakonia sacchari]|uniref:Arabinose operon regulatory protein n=1 Tax=Kosakonia sacchari TaxID=1158459 RepID=A0A1G4XET2_9ENTR|nr:helix-turn-helix transcriptional regulator [Kosakonia sacchari]AHJ74346.1 AraC family transcriptional regulator [Kosakonia sacchari SP1]MDN2484684.1 helix-turn-helix transcriptional regulator [Kosakonia sacchari]NUL35541.1 helix-turn-helix transcriptional regulator [Kosakonia sacchari]SCX39188.1 AraC-type DNA-binding protein [Kosakonia sacchari]